MNKGLFRFMPVSWLEQCLLRRAPQDDPYSLSALWLALPVYMLLGLLQARASSGWLVAVGITALDALVMVSFTWLVLRVAGRLARYVQTLTALAGTGAVLGLIALPLIVQAAQAHRSGEPMAVLVLGWVIMLAWSFTVQAHIFRHALSASFAIGLMVTGLHFLIILSLMEWLFPRTLGN